MPFDGESLHQSWACVLTLEHVQKLDPLSVDQI